MKQECGIISKISNIGHILKYCIGIVLDFISNIAHHYTLRFCFANGFGLIQVSYIVTYNATDCGF